MKIKYLTAVALALTLNFLPTVSGQRRAKPRAEVPSKTVPVTRPTPEPSPTPDNKRRAVLFLKEGDPVTGLFIKADSASVQVEVAGSVITVPIEKIASIDFAEKKAPSAVAVTQNPSLSIEAAIVYNMGGAQPVARTDLYVIDESLPKILRDAGIHVGDREAENDAISRARFPKMPNFKSPPKADTDENLLSDFGLASTVTGEPQFLLRVTQAIRSHTIAHGVTDFAGKLELKDIKPGDYFLTGLVQTRSGYAIWNLPIAIKAGSNSVVLDQKNAAVAF